MPYLLFYLNLHSSHFAVTVISLPAQNIEVSSAKNFTFDVRSLDKLLMQIRYNKGRSIEACGMPPSTSVHEENWPLRSILWFLFLRKLFETASIFPDKPF